MQIEMRKLKKQKIYLDYLFTWLFCPATWLASIWPLLHWYFETQTRLFPWHGTVGGSWGSGGKYPGALYNFAFTFADYFEMKHKQTVNLDFL